MFSCLGCYSWYFGSKKFVLTSLFQDKLNRCVLWKTCGNTNNMNVMTRFSYFFFFLFYVGIHGPNTHPLGGILSLRETQECLRRFENVSRASISMMWVVNIFNIFLFKWTIPLRGFFSFFALIREWLPQMAAPNGCVVVNTHNREVKSVSGCLSGHWMYEALRLITQRDWNLKAGSRHSF